ncbi:MAG: glycosyltransferase family 4 protein [Acidobacteria bacterium]|nr:glycosyltransferase family 4 protein [Acidobacteriota bacterium]
MRVCYVSPTFETFDGWGRYSRALVDASAAAGIDVVVVTTREADTTGLAAAAVRRVLPPLSLRRLRGLLQIAAVPRLRRALGDCDLVHVLVEPCLPAVALAAARSQPLVMTAHGTWAVRPLAGVVAGAVPRRLVKRLDLLVCQSAVTRDAMAARVSLPDHVVAPGGVALEAFEGPGRPIPRVPAGARVVLTVGAVKPRKGHDLALEALARAAEVVGPLHWVVVGDVEANPGWFQTLARRALLVEPALTVHWLGRVSHDQLVGCYRRADVFLLTPAVVERAFEGLGLVFLEAAACALPSVTCLGTGAVEAVRHLETGLVAAEDDARAAGEAIVQVLTDEALRRQLGESARAFARQMTWEHLATRLIREYRRLVSLVRSEGG